jgi:hypothetical protein
MTQRVYVGGLRDVSKTPLILQASGSACTMTQYFMPEEWTHLCFLLTLMAPTGKQLNRRVQACHVVAICAGRQKEVLQYSPSAQIIHRTAVILKSRQPEISSCRCLLKARLSRSILQIAGGHTVLAWSFLHVSNIS